MIRPRFNLKLVFLVTTLIAIWLGIGAIRERRQRIALPVIAGVGGGYSFAATSYFYPFRQVYVVTFTGRQLTDGKLKIVAPHLKGLSGLTYLQLIQTGITDAGLQQLSDLTRLETLHLWDNRVTDAGLTHLARLKSLKELDLRGTLISDAGVASLKSLTGLRTLSVPAHNNVANLGTGLESELAHLGEELIAMQPIPGIVSNRGVASLRQLLPQCKIVHDGKMQFSGEGGFPKWRATRLNAE